MYFEGQIYLFYERLSLEFIPRGDVSRTFYLLTWKKWWIFCKRRNWYHLFIANSSNPIQDGPFLGCSRIGGLKGQKAPFSKICRRYLTLMKLGTVIPYLKKIEKNVEITWHTNWVSFAGISIVSPEISNFCYIKKYRLHFFNTQSLTLLILFEYFKVVSINMVAISIMSAKLASLGLLKIKVF